MKKYNLFGFSAFLAFALFFTVCGSGTGDSPVVEEEVQERQPVVYTAVRTSVEYRLTISQPPARASYFAGDIYILTEKRGETERISSGTVAVQL